MTITAPTPAGPSTWPSAPGQPQPPLTVSAPEPDRRPGWARRYASRWTAGRGRLELALLASLLALTALAYLWDLSASGYANSFYAAAVEAGTKSWKAFFFGSLDSGNFITVDKPPASLWVMALSGRIFGFSSFSMLAPEALMGVGTVAMVYGAVRRYAGAVGGLVAGTVMAITPVAVLMSRFNNPDAMLVFLLAGAAYCVSRSLERASTRWLIGAGTLVGFAFLAKMGQALLPVPAFALAYLVCAPGRLGRRLGQLLAAGAAMVASAGWWVLAVTVWPASSRPMIDGSPDNSIWNLIVSYNGLDRLEANGGGSNFSGTTGVFRLFNSLMGGQASWLLPAAIVALAVGLWCTAREPRTSLARAGLVMWGGWLLVTSAVFSFSGGVIHTYYTVALVPAIAALVGTGAALVWEHRHALWARVVAAVVAVGTAVWADVLLGRTSGWYPWLGPVVLGLAVLGATSIVGSHRIVTGRWKKPTEVMAIAALAIACVAGPMAYSGQTISTAHTGSIPSAGPARLAAGGAGGPGGTNGAPSGRGGGAGEPGPGELGAGGLGPGEQSGGHSTKGLPAGPPEGPGNGAPSSGAPSSGALGRPRGSGRGRLTPGGSGGGGASVAVSNTLVKALEVGAHDYRWVAATDGSQSAAVIELATGGDPVMAIGGFNGNGGNLSLATFEHYVEKGDIHYYIAGGGGGGGPGGSNGSEAQITAWVESHFHSETIGGELVYNLTSPLAK